MHNCSIRVFFSALLQNYENIWIAMFGFCSVSLKFFHTAYETTLIQWWWWWWITKHIKFKCTRCICWACCYHLCQIVFLVSFLVNHVIQFDLYVPNWGCCIKQTKKHSICRDKFNCKTIHFGCSLAHQWWVNTFCTLQFEANHGHWFEPLFRWC